MVADMEEEITDDCHQMMIKNMLKVFMVESPGGQKSHKGYIEVYKNRHFNWSSGANSATLAHGVVRHP